MSKKNFETHEQEVESPEREFRKPEGAPTSLTFVKASELAKGNKIGVILEGEYEGTSENKFNKDKPCFKFRLDNGNMVIVNPAGNLGYQMKSVKEGDYVRLSYLGQEPLTRGSFKGTLCHQFEVLVA